VDNIIPVVQIRTLSLRQGRNTSKIIQPKMAELGFELRFNRFLILHHKLPLPHRSL
jgi:hypothetical protein